MYLEADYDNKLSLISLEGKSLGLDFAVYVQTAWHCTFHLVEIAIKMGGKKKKKKVTSALIILSTTNFNGSNIFEKMF